MRKLLFIAFFLLIARGAIAQQCTQAQLNTEFMTDPTTRGYVSCASDANLAGLNVKDDCVLAKFNAPCTNNAACKVDQVITKERIWEVIDPTELETLARATAANDVARYKELDSALKVNTFNMGVANIRQIWNNIFTGPNSPKTNTAIGALQQKDASRCQIVCNKGNSCTLSDVSLGLRGTP